MAKKHIIWSHDVGDLENWRDYLNEEHPDVTDEDEQWQLVEELNDEYLECEKMNLDFPCKAIAIGSVGLWNRTVRGYILLDNLKEALSADNLGVDASCYCTWWVEGDDMFGEFSHHDGCNYFTYFILKDGEDAEIFWERLINENEEPTPDEIFKYLTPAGIKVREIYGYVD